jgi:hypothetical protein
MASSKRAALTEEFCEAQALLGAISMGLMAVEDSTFREGGLENLGCRPVPQVLAVAPEQIEGVIPGFATPE